MVPFLTHIRSQSKFIVERSSAKMTPSMINQVFFFFFFFFFTVILDVTHSFPSNTIEVRPIYLKMGHIVRKPVFVICEQQAQISLDSNENSYIARLAYTLYLQPVSLRKMSYRYMYIYLSLSFILHERCYTDSVSLC